MGEITLKNKQLELKIYKDSGAFDIYDFKTGIKWKKDLWYEKAGIIFVYDRKKEREIQIDLNRTKKIYTRKEINHCELKFFNFHTENGIIDGECIIEIKLEKNSSEVLVLIKSLLFNNKNLFLKSIHFPIRLGALKTNKDRGWLIIPSNQGVLIPTYQVKFPAEKFCEWDDTFDHGKIFLQLYRMNGLSMPWAGISFKKTGLMMMFEDDFDCGFLVYLNTGYPHEINNNFQYKERISSIIPVFLGSLGELSKIRKLRLLLLSSDDYNYFCKTYLKFKKRKSELFLLKEREKDNIYLKNLRGCLSLTLYGGYPHYINSKFKFSSKQIFSFIKDIKKSGIENAFISIWDIFNRQPPNFWSINKNIRKEVRKIFEFAINAGYLITPYHAISPNLLNTTSCFPEFLFKNSDGKISECRWTANCSYFFKKLLTPCIINEELKTLNPNAYFIDILGTNVFECYHHTHRRSRKVWAEDVFNLFKTLKEKDLITSTETGADYLVGVVDYFDGLMYKFLNHTLIHSGLPIPLFNLVFHQYCVCSVHPLNNYLTQSSLGGLFDKILRDLLFGNIPRFMVTKFNYKKNKLPISLSYKIVSSFHKKIGFDEIINHKFESEDFFIQSTTFSSGIKIIVNFSFEKFTLPDGEKVFPKGFIIYDGKKVIKKCSFLYFRDKKYFSSF